MAPTAVVDPLWSSSELRKDASNLSAKSQSPVAVQHVETDDSSLQTIDELLRSRATAYPHIPIVSYPSSAVEYVDYTFQQLDVFAYRVAKHFETSVPTRTSSSTKRSVVAMMGPSNLEYLVTMMALIKAGHTILFLSTRISAVAVESLITSTGASYIIADAKYLNTAGAVKERQPDLQVLDMPTRSIFEFPVEVYVDTQLDKALNPHVEANETVYIIHSSGSTGLPKPIYQKQIAALSNYNVNMDMKAFITLPLYHNHGICNLYRAIWSRKSIHLYNADLPLTSDFLIRIMQTHKFEIFYGVPYALKLMAETDEGLDLLAKLRTVMYGGSACPDDLGDLLVDHGVNLISHYGATEVGQLMTSFRPACDKGWNYVRESDKLSPFLYWLPQGPNLFECCVRQGWPAKTATNMEDGSYRTKDLFEPHPTIPRAWKYIARLDDTIVLVNGEKFNPVVVEGKIRSSRLVTEAVVFGAQQPYLGVLIVPSPVTTGKSPAEVLEIIWPVVNAAQEGSDSFAKLSKDMIVILSHGIDYPRTDKGSVIRQAFYKTFAKEIETAYDISSASSADARVMTDEELRQHLRSLVLKTLPEAEFDDDTDFFGLGLDSLQAIQIRAGVLKSVKSANKLTQNVVFDHPSISKLSAYLLGTADNTNGAEANLETEMKALVEMYSDFTPPAPTSGQFVVVTGSTGSLGAHIVAKLVRDPTVERVYCLVRAKDTESALRRTTESMTLRKVYHDLSLAERRKIFSIPSDFSRNDLGLDISVYREICSSLRAIIHSAWSVNFNLKLSSFEKDNLAGVKNLITLCQKGTGAFNFCSSVSAVARHPVKDGAVPELEPKPEWAQGMGYAQSKSVAEAICARAAERAGIPVRVLRIGQIVADTAHGIWNATEGVPMVIQSALTVGALPRLREDPSWTPVDVVAQGVAEISLSDAGSAFTNVTNHRTFSWIDHLLPALQEAGLRFEEVEPKEWVQRLRASNPDPVANPPIKLVDFFASKYDKDEFAPSKQYVTETARSLSRTLNNGWQLDQEFVNKFISQFLSGAWKTPDAQPKSEPYSDKTVIVVTGPCGSGKTSIATAVAKKLGFPFVEGDSLHSKSAVDSMRDGVALADQDREPWLARINKRVGEELYDLGYPAAIVSCSSLKRSYRDVLRQAGDKRGERPRTIFLDLQCTAETLMSRLSDRGGHYMKAEMVQSQVEVQERIAESEVDVYPLDAEKDLATSRIYRFILERQRRRTEQSRLVDRARRLLIGPPKPKPAPRASRKRDATQSRRGSIMSYLSGYGSEGRESGARRKKLSAMAGRVYSAGASAMTEIRESYNQTRAGQIDTEEVQKITIPGAFPDVKIVQKGNEQMVLFPSYAKRHIKDQGRQYEKPAGPPHPASVDMDEEEYWRQEWARHEDEKAIVDVDVRGWIYNPHKGPMTRRNRILIGLARQLSGVPAPQAPLSSDASPASIHQQHEEEREQMRIAQEAQEIERRGRAEREAAIKGGYSEPPKDQDSEDEYRTSRSVRSGSSTPSIRSAPRSPNMGIRRTSTGGGMELSEAELAVANANLMARIAPFMTTPLVQRPITVFFYNDDQSQSRTVTTNDSGHFVLRAPLDFVPTHVRVLANEDLSATEPVQIIEPEGISLISDIDDTIKHSSITTGTKEIFRNTFIRDLADLTVDGVKEWYTALYDLGVDVHYCSNSPWQLYPVIASYFKLAGLPPGSIHLKQYSGMLQGIFEPVAERKKGTLEKIMHDFPERRFLLVGDSGEADLEVYTEIAMANPGRIVAIFIRDVTTPDRAGYFDSRFGGSNGREQGRALNRAAKPSRTDAPDNRSSRPALPPRTRSQPEKDTGAAMGDLIDFSEDPQEVAPHESRHLEELRGSFSSDAKKTGDVASKKAPPPRPAKPVSLKSSSATHSSEQRNPPAPPPPRKTTPSGGSSTKPPALHPLSQMHNSSQQGLNGSQQNLSSGASNEPRGSTSSSTSTSSRSAAPPQPPPPRRTNTSTSTNQQSPRTTGLQRRSTTNSDVENMESLPPSTYPKNSYNTGMPSDAPLSKKLDLWHRRLQRAHETLDREGVALYTWRRGGDVVEEAVGLVRNKMKEMGIRVGEGEKRDLKDKR
ncbi:putative gluconokinase [Seiridium cardinale]|uniref:gluconokinase n=1 Tax=Seiridium cardinale TaxID=138064 RepID=A0ABR2XQQ4_9PEZI